jgi:hypothetical protein
MNKAKIKQSYNQRKQLSRTKTIALISRNLECKIGNIKQRELETKHFQSG